MMIAVSPQAVGHLQIDIYSNTISRIETIELLRLNYLMLCELSCTTILIKLQRYNFFCQQIADVGKH